MIYAVWILKNTGEALLNVTFEKLRLAQGDPVLLGGLFSALSEMARQNVGDLTTINITIGEMKLSFTFSKTVIVVVAGDTEDEAKKFGTEIEKAFNQKYAQILDKWNGNVGIFKEFIPEIHKLYQKHGSLESDIEEFFRSLE